MHNAMIYAYSNRVYNIGRLLLVLYRESNQFFNNRLKNLFSSGLKFYIEFDNTIFPETCQIVEICICKLTI